MATGRVVLSIVVFLSLNLARVATQNIHGYRNSGRYASLRNELEKLDELFRLGEREQYDRRQTPAAGLGTATRVHIEMYIRSFGSVNPIQMEYAVDLYLRQRWLEVRFLNSTLTRPLDLSDSTLVKMIWKPEVYFPNAKESDFQYVTVPNVMLRVHPDGSILYILRLKLTFSCMMDLSSYPLDNQTCYIQLASFVKTTRELELEWYDDPVKMYKSLKLPQFQITGIRAESCTQSFHIGNYSCLQAAFELRRNVGYHLVQSYLPTSLIVVVSWVSFWLDVDAIPSRVTLGVTTLLTVCSESTSFRDKMPVVSYVKALDIWMGSCTAFVFLALVEFTVVSHLARHHRRFVFWGSNHGQRAFIYETQRARRNASSNGVPKKTTIQETDIGRPSSSGTSPSSSSPPLSCSQEGAPVRKRQAPTPTTGGETSKTTNKLPPEDNGSKPSKEVTNGIEFHEAVATADKTPTSKGMTRRIQLFHESRAYDDPSRGSSDVSDFPRNATRGGAVDSDLTGLPSQWREKAVTAKRIDVTCRFLFPILFAVFNVAYWTYYDALA